MMRLALCGVVALMGAALAADDKKGEPVDATKLIGKWEYKGKGPVSGIEFLKGGKAVLKTDSKKQPTVDGTYKLEGKKLDVLIKIGDTEAKMGYTIVKLTEDELVTADEKGREETLTRVKSK